MANGPVERPRITYESPRFFTPYPNHSSIAGCLQGHPNGSVVAPAEVDTPFATGQSIWCAVSPPTSVSPRTMFCGT